MTQFRFHTYQRVLDSFAENQRTLGMMNAGRYRGFDTFSQGGALDGTLLHTTTGVFKTDVALAVSDAMGAMITPQGVMIYEDAAIAIAGFGSNIGNNDRLDLIICEHEYLASAGGQAATYSIIAGTPASSATDIPVAPALTNPEKQTIIGTMFIPGGDINLNNAIYTPGIPNITNGRGLALLDQAQQFTKTQSLSQGAEIELDSDSLIKLGEDGNQFVTVLNDIAAEFMSDAPLGTLIELILKTGSQSTSAFVNDSGSSMPVGYIPLLLGDDLNFSNNTLLQFKRVNYPKVAWRLVSTSVNAFDIFTNATDIANLEAGNLPLGVNTDGTLLRTKVVEIGDWDMDADVGKNVSHGIASGISKIRTVEVIIRQDDGTFSADFRDGLVGTGISGSGHIASEGSINITNTLIGLNRKTGGIWDGTDFNTPSSFNRGWITITYEA